MPRFRPIQYLGNKLRVLEEICDAADALLSRRGRIVDLFTGSTMVAQALANRGYEIVAVDSQRYSKAIATAFLSIGRQKNETCIDGEMIGARATELIEAQFGSWEAYASEEEALLREGDAQGLREVYSNLPLIWRDDRNPHFRLVTTKNIYDRTMTTPLFTSIYAGSYFGVHQALRLDGLRRAIFDFHLAGSISTWQMNAALTCVLSAASSAVHSAGKHFAQPLNTSETTGGRFRDRRLLQDRAVSIQESFGRCANAINDVSSNGDARHTAHTDTAENFIATTSEHVDLFYLDPPYTAQQYSRFYHLLETICTYEPPNLMDRGRITTGLYPTNRFKSAFSSKVKAFPAFQKLVVRARRKNSNLLISYSHSASGSDGNARMISLDELLSTCRQQYGSRHVETWTLRHRYRQFNSTRNANEDRHDPEVLIACRVD